MADAASGFDQDSFDVGVTTGRKLERQKCRELLVDMYISAYKDALDDIENTDEAPREMEELRDRVTGRVDEMMADLDPVGQ